MPKPFEKITGSTTDLERDGLFKIVKHEYGFVPANNRYGLIWTLKATKNVTFRHAMVELHRVRDVRFYKKTKRFLVEVHSALLYYPGTFTSFASNGEALRKGEEFLVWVYIDKLEKAVLLQRANHVKFRPSKN